MIKGIGGDGGKLQKRRHEIEREYLLSLPSYNVENYPTGVLLADQIQDYIDRFKLIDPFQPKHLRAAGYELSVGEFCSKGGEIIQLVDKPGSNRINLEPFEMIIVQTLERLNMPEFLIARWNITVGQAYKGLLWVGAAQVDPGFRGYLCCPIYNLSNKPTVLELSQPLAVIDFVATTHPTEKSREHSFNFAERKRLLIEDYGSRESGLVTIVRDGLKRVQEDMTDLKNTVFNSTAIVVAAMGALVAALALFVSNALPPVLTRFSPPLLVSAASLGVSLLALITSATRSKDWIKRILMAIAFLLVTGFLYWYGHRYPIPDLGREVASPTVNPQFHVEPGK